MWVFTKHGFLSAVQHDQDRARMRVRARRREHLDNAFPDYDILDMQEAEGQHDYRWHLDISRGEWIDYLADAAMDVDYTSHVKEAISGDDAEMYRAMMKVWSAMYELQTGVPENLWKDFSDSDDDDDEFGWDDDMPPVHGV
jgi:hypothetical protein